MDIVNRITKLLDFGPDPGAEASGTRASKPTAHILLVDDDPAVRSAARLLLQTEGYRVTTAASLPEALEHARTHPDLKLLITDFHLGGTETGKQVVDSVRELRGPAFRAIVITGDTGSAVHSFDADGNLCWITKPAHPEQLLALVAHLLTGFGAAGVSA